MKPEPSQSPWIRGEPRAHGRGTLVCFSHAGGGASSFASWRAKLPEDIAILRVQLPGHEDHPGDLRRTIGELTPELFEQLRPFLTPPVVLYGHSLGALLAFESARCMRAAGMTAPRLLAVSSRRAPQLPLSHEPASALSDDEFLDHLRTLGGMTERLLERASWRAILFPLMRADLEITDAYAYRDAPPLPSPITAFIGESDSIVHRSEIERWSEQTSLDFRLKVLPGRHFFEASSIGEIIASLTAAFVGGGS